MRGANVANRKECLTELSRDDPPDQIKSLRAADRARDICMEKETAMCGAREALTESHDMTQ